MSLTFSPYVSWKHADHVSLVPCWCWLFAQHENIHLCPVMHIMNFMKIFRWYRLIFLFFFPITNRRITYIPLSHAHYWTPLISKNARLRKGASQWWCGSHVAFEGRRKRLIRSSAWKPLIMLKEFTRACVTGLFAVEPCCIQNAHTFMLTWSEQVTPEICVSEKVIFINSGNSVCIETLQYSLGTRYHAVLSSALIFYIHHHPLAHHSSHIQGVHT